MGEALAEREGWRSYRRKGRRMGREEDVEGNVRVGNASWETKRI